MKTEWLNDREPFPAGHVKAGKIGALIDFEDGTDPQRVYAESEGAMNDKLLTMYGNTRNTVMETRKQKPQAAPPPAAPPSNGAAPSAAITGRMTAAEKIQAVEDLDDAGKAGAAMAKLLAEDSGFDFEEAKREQKLRRQERAAEETRNYHSGEIAKFMAANPDYVGTPKNAKLLRDRTFARAGARPTAAEWEKSYEELLEMDVLDSAPVQQQPPATPPVEPSAPPPGAPRGSTGARPSQLQRTTGPAPAGKRMTRSEALDLAESDDYIDRLQREPGLRERIEQALKTTG